MQLIFAADRCQGLAGQQGLPKPGRFLTRLFLPPRDEPTSKGPALTSFLLQNFFTKKGATDFFTKNHVRPKSHSDLREHPRWPRTARGPTNNLKSAAPCGQRQIAPAAAAQAPKGKNP